MKNQNVVLRAGSTEKLQDYRQAVDRPGRSIKGGKDQFRAVFDSGLSTSKTQSPNSNPTKSSPMSDKYCRANHVPDITTSPMPSDPQSDEPQVQKSRVPH